MYICYIKLVFISYVQSKIECSFGIFYLTKFLKENLFLNLEHILEHWLPKYGTDIYIIINGRVNL